MADFFKSQMDYIFFCYGLAFILLVPLCHFLNRRPRRLLPWVWLGLFGAAHGLNEWLDMLALDLGSGPVFDLVRLSLMALSFVFLVEFGRTGTLLLRGRSPGRWILVALLGVAALGGLAGFSGLCAATRYALGLVGGLWAGWVLFRAAEDPGPGKLALTGASLGMVAYSLATGLMVNPAPFFPASLFNATTFFAATGLPIQLLQGLLALWVSACLCLLAQASLAQETDHRIRVWGKTLMVGAATAVIALLAAGWFITQYSSDESTRWVRNDQEGHAKVMFWVMAHRMEEADHLASALAKSTWVSPALEHRDIRAMEEANAVLDRYSYLVPGAVSYLMDLNGLIIASSNRHQPDSFVGQSMKFRPYFQEAVKGTPGRYWALGVTSKELGFSASNPIRNRSGQIVGVAVFNRPPGDLAELFPPQSLGLVIDSQGIVVLANQPGMVLKSLWPLSPAVKKSLVASRQFGPGSFPPILTREPLDREESLFQGERLIALLQPFPSKDWSIVILSPMRPIILDRLIAIAVTMLLSLGVIGLLTIIGLTIDSTARIQNSESRFRGLYESLRDGSATVDLEGKIVEFNPEFQEMLGYPPEEIYHLTYQEITPEQWQALEARIIEQQVFTRGYSDLYEKEYRRKDGSIIPVEVRTYLIRNDRGIPTGMWAIVRDLTERKRASEALRLAQFSIDQASEPIFWIGPRAEIIYANKAACQGLGYLQQELMVMSIYDIDPSFPWPDWPTQWEALKTQGFLSLESQHRRKDGTVFPVAISLNYSRCQEKPHVFAFIRDITVSKRWERRQTQLSQMREQLLREGRVAEKLKIITDSVVQIFEADFCRIWMIKPGDQCETGCYHAGVTDGPHVCRHRDRCLNLMASSGRYTHIDSPLHGRVPFGCYKIGLVASEEESKFLTNDAQHDPRIHDHQWAQQLGLVAFAGYRLVAEELNPIGVLALFSSRAITPEEDAMLEGVASTTSQIIQMAVAEEALRESEAKYRTMVMNIPARVYKGYADWSVEFFDDVVQGITGYPTEDFNTGKRKWVELIVPEDLEKAREVFIQALRTDKSFLREYRIRNCAGEIRWIRERGRILCHEDGKIDYITGVFSDITEHKQLELELEQLRHQQELILTAAGEGIFGLDKAGLVSFVNPAALEMIGYKPEEMVGQPIHDLIHHTKGDGTPHPKEDCPVYAVLQDGRTHHVDEDIFWRKGGLCFPVEYVATPVFEEEQTVGTVVVFKDISARKQAEEALRQANDRLQAMVRDYDRRHREMSLLSNMAKLLQACQTAEEAYPVISRFAQGLFQAEAGGVYILDFDRNLLEPLISWGSLAEGEPVFPPEDCWGLRRSRVYLVPDADRGLTCRHLWGAGVKSSLCIPLQAQGGSLGMLHLRNLRDIFFMSEKEFTEGGHDLLQQLAATVGDHVALALANIRLRDTLRHQAIRDVLTGLFNRRYLDETLEREIHRARRKETPLGLIMMDLDRFKQFNDHWGHEAGDHLLHTLGDFILSHIRAGDIACRYGGEEFVLILPDASLEVAVKRAEEIRQGVKALPVYYDGKQLGTTISLGVATFPDHGDSRDALMRVADKAVYAAKARGRNQVVVAEGGV